MFWGRTRGGRLPLAVPNRAEGSMQIPDVLNHHSAGIHLALSQLAVLRIRLEISFCNLSMSLGGPYSCPQSLIKVIPSIPFPRGILVNVISSTYIPSDVFALSDISCPHRWMPWADCPITQLC